MYVVIPISVPSAVLVNLIIFQLTGSLGQAVFLPCLMLLFIVTQRRGLRSPLPQLLSLVNLKDMDLLKNSVKISLKGY